MLVVCGAILIVYILWHESHCFYSVARIRSVIFCGTSLIDEIFWHESCWPASHQPASQPASQPARDCPFSARDPRFQALHSSRASTVCARGAGICCAIRVRVLFCCSWASPIPFESIGNHMNRNICCKNIAAATTLNCNTCNLCPVSAVISRNSQLL